MMSKMSMMKLKGKILARLGALFVCVTFISCGNLFSNIEEDPSREVYSQVRYIANLQLTSSSNSRSAIPGLNIGSGESNTMEYHAVATASGQTTVEITGYSSVMELSLTAGHEWHIECQIRDRSRTDSDGHRIVYFSDSTNETVTTAQPVISHDFILRPTVSSTGEGEIWLLFQRDAASSPSDKINLNNTQFVCSEIQDSLEIVQYNFTTGEYLLRTKNDVKVPSGTYELQLRFFDSESNLLYVSNQTINVFDNMTTNQWLPDGEAIDDTGVFKVTSDLVQNFVDTTIYVGVIPSLASTNLNITASQYNLGTAYSPYASINNAIERIRRYGNGSDYRIYVSGEITDATTITGIESYPLTSSKARSITIEGYTGNSTDILKGPTNGKPAVLVDTLVPVTFRNIKITDSNPSNSSYGGIQMKDYAGPAGENDPLPTVNLESGVLITNNKGGVDVGDNCVLNINGAQINENNNNGVISTGKIYFNNGTVNSNSGPGFYICDGSLDMISGEINDNENSSYGGGIYKEDGENAYITISGGKIQGNTATKGAGIYVFGAHLTITGGIIENNEAEEDGGGIFIAENGYLKLSGTSIIRNNSAVYGGAIRFSDGNSFTIEENVYIPYGVNGVKAPGKNDVSVWDGANVTITLDGPLNRHSKDDPIVIGNAENESILNHTCDTWNRGATYVEASSNTMDISSCADLFITNYDDWIIRAHTSDKSKLVLDLPIFVKYDGTPVSYVADGSRAKPYTNLQSACAIMDDDQTDYIILVDTILKGDQAVYDATAHSITIKGANGLYTSGDNAGEPQDVIDGNQQDKAVIDASFSCPLYLENIELTNANHTNGYGGGIRRTGGDLYIKEGTLIRGNKAEYGCGVYIGSGHNLYMSGGKITKNESEATNTTYVGCGINAFQSNVYIYGSAVIGGYNENLPAVPSSRSITLNNGGNYAPSLSGGGVCCTKGNLYLGYSASNDDGTPDENSKVLWTGGIYGNFAGKRGGGVYVSGGKVYMNSGEIAYNRQNDSTDGGGGGICIDGISSPSTQGYCTITGGKIHTNLARQRGGGIFIGNTENSSLTMTGGEIYNNTASKYGGGISTPDIQLGLSGEKFTVCSISGGKIYGNNTSWKTWSGADKNFQFGAGGGIFNAGYLFIYGSAVIGEKGVPVTSENSTSLSNSATVFGGGICNLNGKIYLGYKSKNDSDKPNEAEEWSGGIYCNKAQTGGAIYNTRGEIYINTGTIKGNYACYDSTYDTRYKEQNPTSNTDSGCAGGIFNGGPSNLTITKMTGGLITQNHCDKNGGAVYIGNGDLIMQGYACILPEDDGSNEVYLHSSTNPIKITDELEPKSNGKSTGTDVPYAASINLPSGDYATGHKILLQNGTLSDTTFKQQFQYFKMTNDEWTIKFDFREAESKTYATLVKSDFQVAFVSAVPTLELTGDGTTQANAYQLQYNGVNKIKMTITDGSGNFSTTGSFNSNNYFNINNSNTASPSLSIKTNVQKDNIASSGYVYTVTVKDTVTNRTKEFNIRVTHPSTYGHKTSSSDFAIGDIVFEDGSAVSYDPEMLLTDEQKSKAIAVIFYAGNPLTNSYDYTEIDLGTRVLGVGLKEWTVNTTKKLNGNSTELSPYISMSEYPNGINYMIYTDNTEKENHKKNGRLALQKLKTIAAYNTAAGQIPESPVFFWAEHYGEGNDKITGYGDPLTSPYNTGWYLPAEYELILLNAGYSRTAINDSFDKIGTSATKIAVNSVFSNSENYYLQAIETNGNGIHLYNLKSLNTMSMTGYKNTTQGSARAIREF